MNLILEVLAYAFSIPLALALGLFIRARVLHRQHRKKLRINPNHPCPGCGNEDGKLRLTETMSKDAPVFIQHHCNVCGAEWGEPTVVKATAWFARPQEFQIRTR